MSSSLDVFNEALQRASNPVNPPPARPSALDMPSPASLLDPSLAGHWHNNNQFTPPNTAVESKHTQWHPPSPQQDHTPISQSQQDWPERSFSKQDPSQSFSDAEADFHQQAMAFDGMSQMHNRNEDPSPPRANNNTPGEPPQSKTSAVDDLFSDVDDNEMPDSNAMDQDDNMFDMSGLGQHGQSLNPIQQESSTSLQTIPGINQTPSHADLTDTHDFADPASHPSPTESRLVAEGFEFHNKLPEDVQINRFNDKAFRKALREVHSDLPRKQQWYAWRKAQQMLNSEPESAATTEQMEKNWGERLERQDQNQHEQQYKYQCESEMPPTSHTAASQIEDGIWAPPAQPISLSNKIHGHSGHEGDEARAVDRHWVSRVPQPDTTSSPASTGGFAVGQGDWHASHEARNHGDWASKPEKIDQDRLQKHPLGNLISKVAEEHRARRQREDEDATQILQEAHPSHPAATSRQSSNASASAAAIVTAKKLAELRSLREKLQRADEEVLFKMKKALKAKMVARRDGSAHGLLSLSNSNPADAHSGSTNGNEHRIRAATFCPGPPARTTSTSTSTDALPFPPRPTIEHPTSHLHSTNLSAHTADLLRPHTNTLLRRSPSPSTSQSRHLPPPISPNRRSPSPWIEHPGINRPDTPRPSRPTSPLRTGAGADIRQSVERSSPFSDRDRDRLKPREPEMESTPAYSQRSPSPSPPLHLGISSYTQHYDTAQQQDTRVIDTVMTDADADANAPSPLPSHHTPGPHPVQHQHQHQHEHFPQNVTSSPDPLSSPFHAGNTYAAPTTPHVHLQSSALRPPPIPASTPLRPSKTRRKSIGGQTPTSSTTTTKPKSRNATSVQGANIQKPRNTTRRVTQITQKVVRKTAAATATATAKETATAKDQGSKVAQAVKEIEEGIKGAVAGSPRRSGRLARKKK